MKKKKVFFCCSCCTVLLLTLILTVSSFAKDEEDAGKALVEKKCSRCHSIDRAYGANKNHSEWVKTVEKMMRYSDRMDFLNEKEKEIVIDFLANRKSPQADSEK
ncbi:MAG: cytochrome c [Candidatus Electrothrix sp. AX5]|nr:cytochrome c [Candidatus Electrothrix sp. AX5]